MAFDLASDVERQIYRLRTLCLNPVLSYSSLVRAALPSVHSGSLARLQEVGKILHGLEADYSRALLVYLFLFAPVAYFQGLESLL